MKVYSYEKSFLQRVDEYNFILEEGNGKIKELFADILEETIEPGHYQALWKISRGLCEELNVKYPQEVFGEVKHTYFDQLVVDFKVTQVQDEIALPEICSVPIDEIFPTIAQIHSTVNANITADYLDRYRFFFNYIFLPFDAENEINFAHKCMIPRVKLFYDLKNKQLSKAMASYVRKIIAEVKHIQFKRDLLNQTIEDTSDVDGIQDDDCKQAMAKLLDLHLRMNKIKHEMEILVNPEIRDAYEITKFGRKSESCKQTYVVMKNGTLDDQIKFLEQLKKKISSQTTVTYISSLSDAVASATPESEIFLPCGRTSFNFLDYLNGNLLLCGSSAADSLPTNLEKHDKKNFATIYAEEDSAMLFVIDGDSMRFENLLIDCRNVKTGFIVKSGTVLLRNCMIIGNKDSSVVEGFYATGESSLIFNNCVISNFATAFNVNDMTRLELKSTKIENCDTGINIIGDNVKVVMQKSCILNSNEYPIIKYSEKLGDAASTKNFKIDDRKELEE